MLFSFHERPCLSSMCNRMALLWRISLRIKVHSGAIDTTSRKGVGPGLWGSCKCESIGQSSYRSPMFNLGEILNEKSLIALAVLAASGAAMAQSSVTLYGLADAYAVSYTHLTLPTKRIV